MTINYPALCWGLIVGSLLAALLRVLFDRHRYQNAAFPKKAKTRKEPGAAPQLYESVLQREDSHTIVEIYPGDTMIFEIPANLPGHAVERLEQNIEQAVTQGKIALILEGISITGIIRAESEAPLTKQGETTPRENGEAK
jgi:hypothetical protein